MQALQSTRVVPTLRGSAVGKTAKTGFVRPLKTRSIKRRSFNRNVAKTLRVTSVANKVEQSGSESMTERTKAWMASNIVHKEVVVIGGGMAGTATAYQLAKQAPGMEGVVLEAGEAVAHSKGSSYGESRMFRKMYSDPYFSNLQADALKMWAELEEECGSKLLDVNGLLFYGEPDTGETVEGSIPGCRDVMEENGIPYKYYEGEDNLKAQFSGMQPECNHVGLFEESAGSVNSSLACEEMMRMAAEQGKWSVHCETKVVDLWQPEDGAVYHITTSSGANYTADKVVVCAGAWTNEILKNLDMQLDLELWKVHWGHYKLKEGAAPPQWFHFGKDDRLIYGFPGKDGVGKVGADFSPETDRFDSMEEFNYDVEPEVVAKLDGLVEEQWNDIYAERVEMVASPYTMTKDSMFVLDTLPGHPNVSVFTAGNGRAFKFAPILGRALADLVTGSEPAFDISKMAADRPGLMLGNESKDAFGRAHVPYGEEGDATYSKLTLGCFDVVMNTSDLVDQAVESLAFPEGHPSVKVATYGCADGGPEMPLMHYIKARLPEGCDLEVNFEDQPNNDFKSLFYLASGVQPLPVDCPPLTDDPGIFYTGVGRGFFDQCFARGTLDIGMSFTAMHWLSMLPAVDMPDAVHHTNTENEAALAQYAAQAASDWETIMSHRARELKQGGQMVIATFGVSPEGKYLGWDGDASMANMYREMQDCWTEMRDEGLITAAEHKEASFCNYYRTEEELTAPLEKLGLKVKQLEWRSVGCPFGRGLRPPQELVGTVRTWSNSTFESALSEERPAQERKDLVDQMYGRYCDKIAAEPHRHHMDYTHAYMLLEKL